MDDAFDVVLCDHAFEQVLVAGITDEQRHAFRQISGKARGEIVDHDDVFAGFRQRQDRVTSDIAGSAGDKTVMISPVFRSSADVNVCAVKSGFRRA